MHRVRCNVLLAAVSILPIAAVSVCAAQYPPVPPLVFPSDPSTETTNPPINAPEGSLKVSLRLEEGNPFIGTAEVRLMPEEGYEVIGMQTGTEGEMLFSGLVPGDYSVEASAPAYLAVRLSTQIESGHGQRILYVVMKPRSMPNEAAKTLDEKSAGTTPPAAAKAHVPKSKPAASKERDFWEDHELERNVPPVEPGVECPMPRVLRGVGERMTEFVSNLEKFTATEHLQHYAFDRGKEARSPETRRFVYVVKLSQSNEGTFLLEEYRDGAEDPSQFPARVATKGLSALELIFHPYLSADFEFACEGLGQSDGKPAWQVHFAQRTDRPVRIRTYRLGTTAFPSTLRGEPGSIREVIRWCGWNRNWGSRYRKFD